MKPGAGGDAGVLLQIVGGVVVIMLLAAAYFMFYPIVGEFDSALNGYAAGTHVNMPQLGPVENELRASLGAAFVIAAVLVVVYMFVQSQRKEPDTGYVYS